MKFRLFQLRTLREKIIRSCLIRKREDCRSAKTNLRDQKILRASTTTTVTPKEEKAAPGAMRSYEDSMKKSELLMMRIVHFS